nr:hypothetical protein [bacterium]
MLHDIDARFSEYLADWIEENQGRFKKIEEMEAAIPDEYAAWLERPAAWLGGVSPRGYFEAMDAAALMDTLMAYFSQDISVPEPLLDAIAACPACEDALMELLTGPGGDAGDGEARHLAINLLGEMQSQKPIALYIDWVARGNEADELAEMASERLCELDASAVCPLVHACFGQATPWGQEAFLDILRRAPGDKRTLELLLEAFAREKGKRALYASYLGAFGDEDALPALQDALAAPDLDYLSYVEVRDAIEALGGTPRMTREFAGDPAYEAMKTLTGLEDNT